MWMLDEKFLNLIAKLWDEERFIGSKLFYFVAKLKFIKQKLLWNREKIGNIFEEKAIIEKELRELNEIVIKEDMNQQRYVKGK